MATSTVSHHVFRRNARKMERKLERERLQAMASQPSPDVMLLLRDTSYRVASRRGGLRWVVEEVTK